MTLSWEQIAELEPRLVSLEQAAGCGGDARTWSNLKASFDRLVGGDSSDERLQGSDCRDIVYSRILNAFEDAGGQF